MEIAGDKFVSILTSLEQILDNQRSASDSVAYNKSKIDDVFSMMHNKTLQVNVCVREVREMKTLCAKLRKEIGELKHQVFDCRKLLSLPKAELSPKLPPKTVRWADQVQPAQGITKSSLIQRQFSLPTYFSQATISDSLMNQSFRLPLVPGMSRPSPVTELSPWPSYIEDRIIMWDRLKVQYAEELARKVPEDITVTLPDGKELPAQSWRTTPYEIAMGISFGLADNVVSCKVNNVLWDLERPLEESCKLELLKFDNPEAEQVFWHSSAHILGEAMERMYGGYLCYGPPIESGFYYDMHMPNTQVSNIDFPVVENIMKTIVKERQPFERLEMKKEDLLEMFKYNEFKQRILKEKVTTPTTTVYRCGSLIDLCRGPHIRHTGKVKAFKITKNSATYWEGKSDAESLQRIYGIAFPDNKKMKEWEKFQEEAAKRDHRKLGREQELYFFHELSPGSCFFQPRGAHIYNKLIEFIRSEYRKRGFQEVVTPNIFNAKLWQTSGHWEHYADNMFSFDVEKEMFALKPMNCPGHCLVFDHRPRSWRELPLRMADFGVLHRNELSGALTGLTRVRRFQQDDAHIFCAVPQIKAEITGALDFLRHVYGVFGFTFQLCLSTRPDKFLGDIAVWEEAEKQLADSLNDFGEPWRENPGDGAFYGPKIDITIMDALRRNHQCATIQLDFQLPIRFNLAYINEAGEKTRPVIIHRAILGSVERMIAILTESYAGKWPFWLSPRQIMIIPVGPPFNDYAEKVKDQLYNAGFVCEVDSDAGDTMNKKIRNAQLAQYNFILVVGEREQTAETVNVRTRDNVIHGELNIPDLISKFRLLTEKRSSEDVF
ncbi:threonine--tRNA ligase 1, cytoplasmic-like isoform X1 [Homalodisca vitripennis]|uniref:threonine--tRNA ligase 1, cytoplasmic-like isoform X1 n=2 Tax=Homalodisca vitripennis TaxID=197043 RepID=UPI001EE9BC63|nr:threonine--tRNA ligase 1, cytoplasmic-like isoform X1 [Homalodisca vitripennis]